MKIIESLLVSDLIAIDFSLMIEVRRIMGYNLNCNVLLIDSTGDNVCFASL